MKKYFRLLAIVMLMMIVKSAYSAAVDFDLPEEGKRRTESQMYYDLIPLKSKWKLLISSQRESPGGKLWAQASKISIYGVKNKNPAIT